MRRLWMWMRWSARDLRSRWVQVTAIAMIIAVGTGMTAGLGSMSVWRRASYDASYALLNHFDVRVELAEGSVAPEGALLDAAAPLVERGWVVEAEERLSVPTQVDASSVGETNQSTSIAPPTESVPWAMRRPLAATCCCSPISPAW